MTLQLQSPCYMLYDNDIGRNLLQCNVMAALIIVKYSRLLLQLSLSLSLEVRVDRTRFVVDFSAECFPRHDGLRVGVGAMLEFGI